MCPITPLIVVCPVLVFLLLFVTAVKGIIMTFREPSKPGCLLGENSDHFHCLRKLPLLISSYFDSLMGMCVSLMLEKSKVDTNKLANT